MSTWPPDTMRPLLATSHLLIPHFPGQAQAGRERAPELQRGDAEEAVVFHLADGAVRRSHVGESAEETFFDPSSDFSSARMRPVRVAPAGIMTLPFERTSCSTAALTRSPGRA